MCPATDKPHQDTFTAGGVKFSAWDLGGHDAVRHLWDDFMATTGGVVFMVDACDSDRLLLATPPTSYNPNLRNHFTTRPNPY